MYYFILKLKFNHIEEAYLFKFYTLSSLTLNNKTANSIFLKKQEKTWFLCLISHARIY